MKVAGYRASVKMVQEINHCNHHRLHKFVLWGLLVLLLFLTAWSCQSLDLRPRSDEHPWHEQVTLLEMNGFAFNQGEVVDKRWHSVGVSLGNGLLLTNAHAVMRAESVDSVEQDGDRCPYDTLLALDTKNDLAILSSKRCKPAKVRLVDRPLDPRILRKTQVFSIVPGTGSFLQLVAPGEIAAFFAADGYELFYMKPYEMGAVSEGPVFSNPEGSLIGYIRKNVEGEDVEEVTPAWYVSDLLKANKRSQVSESWSSVFSRNSNLLPKELLFEHDGQCIKPGERLDFPFSVAEPVDVLVSVVPDNKDAPYLLGTGKKDPSAGLSLKSGDTRFLHTLTGHSETISLGVETDIAGSVCFNIKAYRIDWAAPFRVDVWESTVQTVEDSAEALDEGLTETSQETEAATETPTLAPEENKKLEAPEEDAGNPGEDAVEVQE